MNLNIVKFGDPVLREETEIVDLFDRELLILIENMFDTMYSSHGIGLAAPQIGVSKKIIIIDTKEENTPPLALINPSFMSVGDNKVSMREGCLSFPEIYVDVTRSEQIEVHAQNPEGNPVEFKADGLLARVVQHELDHLNGVLFVDYLNMIKKSLISGKLKKLKKESLASAGQA